MLRAFRAPFAAVGASAFALFAATAASPQSAQATQAAMSAAAIAADDEALLAFAGGEPLTATDRERVAAEIRDGLHKDPAQFLRADKTVRRLLVKLPGLSPAYADAVREELRLRFALLPAAVLERQIVEEHDPTVVFERADERLITERTIVALQHASAWLAKQLDIPGPSDDFVPLERTYFKDRFTGISAEQQAAYAHIARDFPASVELFNSWSADRRKAWIAQARNAIGGPVRLEAFTAVGMARGYNEAHASEGSAALFAAMLKLQNMQRLVLGLQGEIGVQQVSPRLISPGF